MEVEIQTTSSKMEEGELESENEEVAEEAESPPETLFVVDTTPTPTSSAVDGPSISSTPKEKPQFKSQVPVNGNASESEESEDDEQARTLFVGNLSPDVDFEIMYELFLQAGPIEKVDIPKDRETGKQKAFGFVLYEHKCAVEYACNIFEGTRLFGRELRIRNRKGDKNDRTPNRSRDSLVGLRTPNATPNAHMLPQTPIFFPGSAPGMPPGMNPEMFLRMSEQMMQQLGASNPFANFGQAQNGAGGSQNRVSYSSGKDRGNWMRNNHHADKPYDRRQNGYQDRNRDQDNRRRRDRSRNRRDRRNDRR